MTRLTTTPSHSAEAIEALRDGFVAHLSQTIPGRKELVVAEASGCTLKMADGRLYLDMISGIAVSNVGHSHPKVVAAVREQMGKYAHVNVYGRFVVPGQVEIAERLARVAPGDLEVAFLTSTGTEANEGALKLARKHTGRPGFVAFERGFHGRTFGSLSVSWKDEYRKPFEPLLEGVRFVPFDDLAAVDAALDDTVAAVIVEPVQGEGGVRIPSDDFLPGLRRLCTERGALLIADEIQGAMGRAGHWFSFQQWDVVPDIVTLAKAFGGGLPLGAILSSRAIFDTFLDPPLSHLTTFGGNPVACAAAVAAFDVIESEGLIERGRQMGDYLRRKLESVRHQFPDRVTEIRGIGLWYAVDIAPDELAQPLVDLLADRGVIVGSMLNSSGTIRIAPPLIVEQGEIDVLIGALRGALADQGRRS
jgi:acetylornithine/succinyldiaminopimelate/putrescine aminotransferase